MKKRAEDEPWGHTSQGNEEEPAKEMEERLER